MGKNQIRLIVTPKDTYFGTEYVSGELQLVIQKTINVREILLAVVGTETVTNGHHRYVFLKEHFPLTGGSTKEQTLGAGNTYVFHFNAPLPAKLPASCKFVEGDVKYILQATVNVKFKADLVARQEINVGGDIYDSDQFIHPVPFVQSENKSFLIGSGDLSCKVTASKKFVYSGDEIQLYIEVNNQSSKKIQSVTTQFLQRMSFASNPGSNIGMAKRKITIDPQKTVLFVEANSNAHHTAVIRTRPEMPPTLEFNGSNPMRLIRVIYKVRVILEVSKAIDMRVDIPVVLKRVNPLTDPKNPLFVEQMKARPQIVYNTVSLAQSPYVSQTNLYVPQNAPYPAQQYPPPAQGSPAQRYPAQGSPAQQHAQYPPYPQQQHYAQYQTQAYPPAQGQNQPYPPAQGQNQPYPPAQAQNQPYPPAQGQNQPYPPVQGQNQPYPSYPPQQQYAYPPAQGQNPAYPAQGQNQQPVGQSQSHPNLLQAYPPAQGQNPAPYPHPVGQSQSHPNLLQSQNRPYTPPQPPYSSPPQPYPPPPSTGQNPPPYSPSSPPPPSYSPSSPPPYAPSQDQPYPPSPQPPHQSPPPSSYPPPPSQGAPTSPPAPPSTPASPYASPPPPSTSSPTMYAPPKNAGTNGVPASPSLYPVLSPPQQGAGAGQYNPNGSAPNLPKHPSVIYDSAPVPSAPPL